MKSDLLESKALENPFNKTAHPEWESLWEDFYRYYVIRVLGKCFACLKMDFSKYYVLYKDIRKVWIFVDFDKYYIIRILGKCFACFKMKWQILSSPRAKRAGPKGLRAESARAVTGRRCPHSGVG